MYYQFAYKYALRLLENIKRSCDLEDKTNN